jgi:hypothetical protein
MKKRLLVHKTLRTGFINHWIMFNQVPIETIGTNKRSALMPDTGPISFDTWIEIYEVSSFHLVLIDIFEFLCGWIRIYSNEHNAYCYKHY